MINIEKNCVTICGEKYEVADFIVLDLIFMIMQGFEKHHVQADIKELSDSLSEALEEIEEELI